MTQDQKNFIAKIGAAAADMKTSGVLASLTIAQAILESGWGKSGLTVKGNALFGIKATAAWKGKVYNGQTQGCYDGVSMTTVSACFKAYDSWADSVADHSALLTGAARYKAVIGERDYKKACHAIKAAGRWQENDAFVPQVGDVIFYDWQDSGVGDNMGAVDHVGLVVSVSGGVIVEVERERES